MNRFEQAAPTEKSPEQMATRTERSPEQMAARTAKTPVQFALEELIEKVRESDEYVRYRELQDKVHAVPKLAHEVNAFRNENYLVQNSDGTLDIYEETDRMEREYREWRKNPLVSEYLAAESAFCRMFQQINWALIEALDFEAGLVD